MTDTERVAVPHLREREQARLRLIENYMLIRGGAQALMDDPGPVAADGELVRAPDGSLVPDEEIRRQAREVVAEASQAIVELLAA